MPSRGNRSVLPKNLIDAGLRPDSGPESQRAWPLFWTLSTWPTKPVAVVEQDGLDRLRIDRHAGKVHDDRQRVAFDFSGPPL